MSSGPPAGRTLSSLMHLHLILLAQSTTPTTAAKSSKSSGSNYEFLIIIAVFAALYFLFLRPRQKRLRQQQTAAKTLAVGDEVMSAGGIFGRVVALDTDAVEVEVAPGVVMTFLPKAISPRAGGRGTAAAPVDEPWNTEPDGPGDTAGPPELTDGNHEADPGRSGEGRPPAPGSPGA